MRYMYNTMYGRMVPLRNDGWFDYAQPLHDQHLHDVRTPYHRNEVYLPPKTDAYSTLLRKKYCTCPLGFCTC